MSGRTFRTASFVLAFAGLPLYPAFIGLTRAPVPGLSVVPHAAAVALFVLAVVLAIAWSALLLASPPKPMPTVAALAALPAAAIVAALLGFDPRAGVVFIAILLFGVVWHAAILRFVEDAGAIRAVLAAFLISGALASLLAIVLVVTKTPAELYTIGHGRATGTFVLPGELAGYLIVYVPVAIGTARAPLGLRGIALGGALVACAAFVLTFSRAGWLGMAAAIAALILLRGRGQGMRAAAAIVGAALVAVALVFNSHHDPSENFTRISIWEAALRTIAAFPFSGVGPFAFASTYHLTRVPGGEPVALHAHSIVLTIAAETGLAGLAALAWVWWRFAAELAARLRTPSPLAGPALAIAAGLIGTWVQGIVDTVSIVIFGLWLPFMALALACAGPAAERAPVRAAARWPGRRAVVVVAATAAVLACAVVQLASSAIDGWAAAPYALPARLPESLGVRIDSAIERVAPLPSIERLLAEDALRRHDARDAARYAAKLPPGNERDDLEARIAAQNGSEGEAVASFLAAGDDRALQPIVARLAADGRVRDAYALESRVRDRLAGDETRPNALADSWWRLGRLAARMGDVREAARDDARAIALAPLNTKYLLDAGELALARNDAHDAAVMFGRALDADPADARAARLLRTARARLRS
ncbi:MAG TPA: O-antigen ligase family protein [Candidatus Elarobacter sp.]|nr:O-antigen ligase family protein [Candidatus Elarobacter sp.]